MSLRARTLLSGSHLLAGPAPRSAARWLCPRRVPVAGLRPPAASALSRRIDIPFLLCPPLATLIRARGGARIRLMPTARLPLVGRRDEMAALEDELARAAAGEFRVVLLSGEAGVGKSRLGRELLARRHRQCPVEERQRIG